MLHNNNPPDSRQATRHTSPAPNRNTHARAATATASNASATPLPAGITGPSSGSNTTAHRAKYPRTSPARNANRRSQPRTVSFGTPSRPAITRCPAPAIFASIARPITNTSSRRRNKHKSANNTCVPAHPRQRARLGRSDRSPAAHRNTRLRANPHGPNLPRHDGHTSAPLPNSASTRTSSAHTINIGATSGIRRALPTATKQTGGLSRVQKRAKPANSASTITTINSTSSLARAQTQQRSTRAYTERFPAEIDELLEANRRPLDELRALFPFLRINASR